MPVLARLERASLPFRAMMWPCAPVALSPDALFSSLSDLAAPWGAVFFSVAERLDTSNDTARRVKGSQKTLKM